MGGEKSLLSSVLELATVVEKQARQMDAMNDLLVASSLAVVSLRIKDKVNDETIKNLKLRIQALEGR